MKAQKTMLILGMLLILFGSPAVGEIVCEEQCPECDPGECMASSGKVDVGHGLRTHEKDPACIGDTPSKIALMIQEYAESNTSGDSGHSDPALKAIISDFSEAISHEVAKLVSKHAKGDVGKILSGYTGPKANCQPVAVAIPPGATITRSQIWVIDYTKQEWAPTKCCHDISWARFIVHPTVQEAGSRGSVAYTILKNWSHNKSRYARLDVYFTGGNFIRSD